MLVPLGKLLIGVAALIFVVGLVVLLIGKLGVNRVPGDIIIQRGKLTVFFPVVSCLLISIVLSLIMTLLARLRR